MAILIYADHDGKNLSPDTAKILTAAQHIGSAIDIFLCGHHIEAIVEQAAKFVGIRRVLYADASYLNHFPAEPISATLASLAPEYTVFMASAQCNGKNIMPRLAALLDVMQISNIIAILDPDTFKRPIYTGSAIATVKSHDSKKVLTVQSSAFSRAAFQENKAPIIAIEAEKDLELSSFVNEEKTKLERPNLTNAKIIVSGGRGLGSKENFEKILFPLADKLNAAIGASRSAVDAGYAPNDWQVGQTGKIVAPELYIAIGISGAIQHTAGMKDSKIVVAINKDKEAPILQIADYAFIGDLFEIVPNLEKHLSKG